MTFRAVAMVAAECDLCGRRGLPAFTNEEAEYLGEQNGVQRAPKLGKHICRKCQKELTTGGAAT